MQIAVHLAPQAAVGGLVGFTVSHVLGRGNGSIVRALSACCQLACGVLLIYIRLDGDYFLDVFPAIILGALGMALAWPVSLVRFLSLQPPPLSPYYLTRRAKFVIGLSRDRAHNRQTGDRSGGCAGLGLPGRSHRPEHHHGGGSAPRSTPERPGPGRYHSLHQSLHSNHGICRLSSAGYPLYQPGKTPWRTRPICTRRRQYAPPPTVLAFLSSGKPKPKRASPNGGAYRFGDRHGFCLSRLQHRCLAQCADRRSRLVDYGQRDRQRLAGALLPEDR